MGIKIPEREPSKKSESTASSQKDEKDKTT